MCRLILTMNRILHDSYLECYIKTVVSIFCQFYYFLIKDMSVKHEFWGTYECTKYSGYSWLF